MFQLQGKSSHEIEIKKSRFICYAAPIQNVEDAMAYLAEVKDEEATHNCYAYKLGSVYRFFDDGEPSGTAGRPILTAIEGQNIDNVMVVVVRFFGGTKLGAGGLVRAYSNAAANCLRLAPKEEYIPTTSLSFTVPFNLVSEVHQLISKFHATKTGETYETSGVLFSITIKETEITSFRDTLINATAGKAMLVDSD